MIRILHKRPGMVNPAEVREIEPGLSSMQAMVSPPGLEGSLWLPTLRQERLRRASASSANTILMASLGGLDLLLEGGEVNCDGGLLAGGEMAAQHRSIEPDASSSQILARHCAAYSVQADPKK